MNKNQRWTAPAIAFGAVFLPGVALASLRGYLLYDVVICLSESVLAAGTCFFFQRAVEALLRREKTGDIKRQRCLLPDYCLCAAGNGAGLFFPLAMSPSGGLWR